jgi:hypothetical protein
VLSKIVIGFDASIPSGSIRLKSTSHFILGLVNRESRGYANRPVGRNHNLGLISNLSSAPVSARPPAGFLQPPPRATVEDSGRFASTFNVRRAGSAWLSTPSKCKEWT